VIEATLSSKNQIVIPREAREALGVRAGDKLLVVVRGDTVIILPRPRSWSKALRGLAGKAYPKGYLDKERGGWA
jgi:AbrB family looped-hinge helix DNA binding protein